LGPNKGQNEENFDKSCSNKVPKVMYVLMNSWPEYIDIKHGPSLRLEIKVCSNEVTNDSRPKGS